MKFVALLTGKGEGCDYTIGCNKTFDVFEAEDTEAALKHCRQICEEHGVDRIDEVNLFVVSVHVPVPFDQWDEEAASDSEEDLEEELRAAEARASELRKRLGKK
jgi:hypothetical protein